MEKQPPSERRKYRRIPSDQVISFAPVDAREHLAVIKDLSTGGIRFEAVACEVSLGETLRVTFNVDDQTVVAVGRVAWAIETDPITLDVGIEFVEVGDDALRILEEAADG